MPEDGSVAATVPVIAKSEISPPEASMRNRFCKYRLVVSAILLTDSPADIGLYYRVD